MCDVDPLPAPAAEHPRVELDYARRPRVPRRARRLIWLGLFLLLAGAGAYWGRPYWKQARVVWDQRRLTHFEASPDTVAFTNDPDEARRLFPGGRHVRVDVGYEGSGNPFPPGLAGFAPAELDELVDPRLVKLRTMKAYHSSDPLGPPPTLFLGMRRAPGGERRLVHVTMSLWWDYIRKDAGRFIRGPDPGRRPGEQKTKGQWYEPHGFWRLTLVGRIYVPATLRPGSQRSADVNFDSGQWSYRGPGPYAFLVPLRVTWSTDNPGGHPDLSRLRIRYAHPHPADEAKIVIPYECDGEPGIFTGTLQFTPPPPAPSGGRATEGMAWETTGPVNFWPDE